MSRGPRDGPPGAEQGRLGPPEGARRPRRRPARARVPGRATASWTWASAGSPWSAPTRSWRSARRWPTPRPSARPTVVLTATGAGRAGPRRRRPPGPRQALPGRPLGGGQGPVQGAAARPVAPRPLPGRGAAGAPPPGGRVPPVPAGVLDAATAWRAIFHHAFGMEDREPDLPGLLRWAAHGDRGGPLPRVPGRTPRRRAAPPGRDAGAGRRVDPRRRRGGRGPRRPRPGRRLRGRLRRGGGRARPPGRRRAAGAVPPQPADPAGRRPAPGPGRRATRSTTWTATSPSSRRATCCGPTRCSGRSRPRRFAHLGRLTPLAWEGRLRRFARALAAATDARGRGRPWPPAEDAAGRVADQRPPGSGAPRTSSSGRGWRCGWPAGSAPPRRTRARSPSSPARYRDEVAFVGPGPRRARRGRRPGRAVRRLRPPRAGRRRRAGPRSTGRSASALADWTRSGSDPGAVLRVEDVLARVVARVARRRRSPSCWSCSTG